MGNATNLVLMAFGEMTRQVHVSHAGVILWALSFHVQPVMAERMINACLVILVRFSTSANALALALPPDTGLIVFLIPVSPAGAAALPLSAV